MYLIAGLAALAGTAPALASGNLITNGTFEGGSLSGWSIGTTGGDNSFYLNHNGSNAPVSGFAAATNAGGGSFYAISDQTGGGGETLSQSFTTTGYKLIVSFDWFNNSHFGQFGTAVDGLDQVGRIDILSGSAGAFDVGAGVVHNFVLNQGSNAANPWQTSTFTLNLAPGAYQLRFATGQYCFFQEIGVTMFRSRAFPNPPRGAYKRCFLGFGQPSLRPAL